MHYEAGSFSVLWSRSLFIGRTQASLRYMSDDVTGQISTVLMQMTDESGMDLMQLSPLIYNQVKMIARRKRRSQPLAARTLNTTALVNEAYIKLKKSGFEFQNRDHFFATCTLAIRQVLVDAARARLRNKRQHERVDLEVEDAAAIEQADEVLSLHENLNKLEAVDSRLAKVVQYRFFMGMSENEIADLLELSSKTVQRDWVKARGWLRREMT